MLTNATDYDSDNFAIFDRFESEVRCYCREFPTIFAKATGHTLIDTKGRSYIDFLSGAGALNYGHNNKEISSQIIAYIESGGIAHSLDLYTDAKRLFIQEFQKVILAPRALDYKIQFTGPTGTNSVEAALKLARRITKRVPIAAFTNAFHGMTLGSLAASGASKKRVAAGLSLSGVERLPYDGYLGSDFDTCDYIEKLLEDPGSGFDPPAAFIVETVQAEGGLGSASPHWLRRLREIATRYGSVLIIDEVQTGCGRTGPFFSFERSGIVPDMVCLSKSISGFGLPMAILLIRPEMDLWNPGEHSGTFRGNNLAFVAGTAALRFWGDPGFQFSIETKGELVGERLSQIARKAPNYAEIRGLGMLRGVTFRDKGFARRVSRRAFKNGALLETCGGRDEVLKVMPPLTITEEAIERGLAIVEESIFQELS